MARKHTPPKKDFLCYKNGWQMRFVPQTPAGWRAMGWWMLILLMPVVPFAALAMMVDDTPQEHWALYALIPLFLIMGWLIWIMIRWMLPRSEIVEPGRD